MHLHDIERRLPGSPVATLADDFSLLGAFLTICRRLLVVQVQ